jgi:hypothetical protein
MTHISKFKALKIFDRVHYSNYTNALIRDRRYDNYLSKEVMLVYNSGLVNGRKIDYILNLAQNFHMAMYIDWLLRVHGSELVHDGDGFSTDFSNVGDYAFYGEFFRKGDYPTPITERNDRYVHLIEWAIGLWSFDFTQQKERED